MIQANEVVPDETLAGHKQDQDIILLAQTRPSSQASSFKQIYEVWWLMCLPGELQLGCGPPFGDTRDSRPFVLADTTFVRAHSMVIKDWSYPTKDGNCWAGFHVNFGTLASSLNFRFDDVVWGHNKKGCNNTSDKGAPKTTNEAPIKTLNTKSEIAH
ncbi:hypothetical protein POM88_030605 [Heracleum sosnowskyi]|uniref:Uncharacterized protein n=1 Tax=Heracleum sosnowskyi TaxID=360622 RepID=A0AAD8HXQ7_9APIA|nr:hypothetical protein POM88_030605 [Heracleum sosnowskyi]